MTTHRWAILGTGGIARQFATDLGNVADATLVAVGSGDPGRGRSVGTELDASHGGSYRDAVAQDVDCVYVANNHLDHADAAALAIDAGRHVLVEKPFACSRADADAVLAHARSAGVFAMEAMWTRFLPVVDRARELLAEGAIGDVRTGHLELGRDQRGRYPRIFDPARAGGALLDMGVYPIAMAQMLLGPADEVVDAVGRIEGGVDVETRLTTRHGAATVTIATAATEPLEGGVRLEGRDGTLVIPDPPHHAAHLELHRDGGVERIEVPFEGHGFEYEITAMQRHVEAGRVEAPEWTHADTLATHAVMDEVRRRIGLVYPFEDGPPPGDDVR